jgi:hypothetical protein
MRPRSSGLEIAKDHKGVFLSFSSLRKIRRIGSTLTPLDIQSLNRERRPVVGHNSTTRLAGLSASVATLSASSVSVRKPGKHLLKVRIGG